MNSIKWLYLYISAGICLIKSIIKWGHWSSMNVSLQVAFQWANQGCHCHGWSWHFWKKRLARTFLLGWVRLCHIIGTTGVCRFQVTRVLILPVWLTSYDTLGNCCSFPFASLIFSEKVRHNLIFSILNSITIVLWTFAAFYYFSLVPNFLNVYFINTVHIIFVLTALE